MASIIKEDALYGAGRFFVGSIQTPDQGAPNATGNNDGGAGAQSGSIFVFNMGSFTTGATPGNSGPQGNGACSHPERALDGDKTTYAELSVTANNATNQAVLVLFGPPGVANPGFKTISLQLLIGCNSNSVSPNLSTSLCLCDFGTNSTDFSGTTTPISTPPMTSGATFSPQYLTLSIPSTTNLARVAILINLTVVPGMTSGTAKIQVFEATIVATV